ncbi:cation diffusion facilitator family transporter [Anaerotardibacter muris]|uniref:cation diffusion facilitator family transporter n=1 Tax=Anaerotardibacter muris TaxID=2941505 RepID=UPI00203E1D12|nr:cation diffusion facilitator family transporter [Anaerotardibacter muris]
MPEAHNKPAKQDATESPVKARERKIVFTSFVGIAGNLLLTAIKLVAGILANSIAVILDAVNSLTDAGSSIITIIGTKLSNKKPNKEHPYGYGRLEYVTSMAIAVIILYAGIASLVESVKKIIWPEALSYSTITVVVIIIAVVTKIIMGIYFNRAGHAVNSQPLIASGKDNMFDAILSGGTLVSAFLSMVFNLNIDGIIGAFISLFIVKAGIDILREAVSSVIGERVDTDYAHQLEAFISSFEGVHGVYDLSVDNYGPNERVGSAHIEVDDNMRANQIHELTRSIALAVYRKFNCIITIGIYASNTTGEYAEVKTSLEKLIKKHPEVLQMHGFYVDSKTKTCYFDLVVDFDHDAEATADEVISKMKAAYPSLTFATVLDHDISD